MHVYFIRHGETFQNTRHVHQLASTPLSPRGADQARTTAEFLRAMNVDYILSSDYTRAVETARIIGGTLGIKPRVSLLFREIERPSRLGGKSFFTIDTFGYILLSVLRRNNPGWRYSDAENFNDIYERSQRAYLLLESLVEAYQSVVVVSHTMFINLMVAYMCHGRMLAVRDLLPAVLHIEKTHNGGLVEIEYTGGNHHNSCNWDLVVRDGKIAEY